VPGRSRAVHRGGRLDEHRVGLVPFVDQPVVAVFRKRGADARRRLIHPHEIVVADHERQVGHRLGEDAVAGGLLGLRIDTHAGTVLAGKAAVQRRETPLSDDHWPAHDGVHLHQLSGHALDHAAQSVGPPQVLEIHARVSVKRVNVVILAGCAEDCLGRAPGEAAAEHEMLGIGLAHRAGGHAEVALGNFGEEFFTHFGEPGRGRRYGGRGQKGGFVGILRTQPAVYFGQIAIAPQ